MGFGATASGSAEARGERGVAEDGGDGVGEGGVVAFGDEQRRFLMGDSFFHAGSAKSDDGEGHGLSFADGHVEGFGNAVGSDDAGRSEERGAMHEIADDGGRLGAEEGDVAGGGAGLSAERIEQRSVADDEQFCGGMTALDEGHGADEMGAAFDFDEAADKENDGVARAGAEGIRREEIEIDAGVEGVELVGGKSAGEGALAEMFGDADEESGAGEELGAAAEKDAAGRCAAERGVGRGDVVSVKGDDEGNVETALDRQSRGSVDDEVSVEERGAAAPESVEEVGSEGGFEEEAATDSGGEGVGSREEQRLFGIDREAGVEQT